MYARHASQRATSAAAGNARAAHAAPSRAPRAASGRTAQPNGSPASSFMRAVEGSAADVKRTVAAAAALAAPAPDGDAIAAAPRRSARVCHARAL